MLELLQQAVQQFGRMADGYQRIADELHRANAIRLQSLFLAQLTRAMDDPVLAETLSGWPDPTEDKRRQLLKANAQYGLILLTHRVGIIDRSELLGRPGPGNTCRRSPSRRESAGPSMPAVRETSRAYRGATPVRPAPTSPTPDA